MKIKFGYVEGQPRILITDVQKTNAKAKGLKGNILKLYDDGRAEVNNVEYPVSIVFEMDIKELMEVMDHTANSLGE